METLKDWQERVKQAGYRVQCPVCKNIASIDDFKKLGVDPQRMAEECIGRHIPGSRDAFTETGDGPCNYACYGLFQHGEHVRTDEGKSICVMPPAPIEGTDQR